MSNHNQTSNGVGLVTVVFVVFLILKLTDNVTWSWIWVFSPYWIIIAFVVAILIIALPFYLVREIVQALRRSRSLDQQYRDQIKKDFGRRL